MKPLRKHLKLIGFYSLMLIFSLRCSKESIEEEVIKDYGYIQFKIDNKLKVIEGCSAFLGWTEMGIEGYSEGKKILWLSFPGNTPGTYPINREWIWPDYLIVRDSRYLVEEGSVTVTEIINYYLTRTSAQGTFNFTCKNREGDTITVTEGVFDIK